MKKTRMLVALVALILVMTAGLAVAQVVKDCTLNTKPECKGTDGDDDFVGEDVGDGDKGSKDIITGGEGNDGGDGNDGDDEMYGGPGVDGEINDFEGNDGDDFVDGGEGDDDELEGNAGDDIVKGGPGDDAEVNGGEDDDEVFGGSGDDGSSFLSGGSGKNTVHGDGGDDIIAADQSGPGDKEKIFGDDDDDTINAADGEKDTIDCGKGNDTVTFDDVIDTVKGCENKIPV